MLWFFKTFRWELSFIKILLCAKVLKNSRKTCQPSIQQTPNLNGGSCLKIPLWKLDLYLPLSKGKRIKGKTSKTHFQTFFLQNIAKKDSYHLFPSNLKNLLQINPKKAEKILFQTHHYQDKEKNQRRILMLLKSWED